MQFAGRLLALLVAFTLTASAQNVKTEIANAFILETVMPGAGLAYAGEYEEAAFSFGVSASLFYMVHHDRGQGKTGQGWLTSLIVFRVLEVLNASQRVVCTPDGRIRVEFKF
jgi:hypothetical protein